MGIPLVALGIKPPQINDYATTQHNALANQQLANQNALAPGQLQEQQNQLKEQQYQIQQRQAINDAYKASVQPDANGRPQINTDSLSKALAAGGHGSAIPQILEGVTKYQTSMADLTKKQQEIQEGTADLVGHAAVAVKAANYDPRLAHTILDSLPPSPQIQQMRAQIDNPQALKQMVDTAIQQSPFQQKQAGAEKVAEIRAQGKPPEGELQLGDKAQQFNSGLQTRFAVNHPGQTLPPEYTLSPTSTQKDYDRITKEINDLDTANNQKTSLNLRKTEVANQGANLSDKAMDQAAEQYWSTGKLPSNLGRNGAAQKQIMNRAAQLHSDGSLATNSAEYKANSHSLDGLQKQFDQVTAFENTAGKNLDVFLNQAKGIVDSGIPLINKPLREVTGQLGGEQQAAFNAARTTALTEIAKVLSSANAGSGVLSDSARHEVEGLIGSGATLKQIYSAANILKQDMQNRHDSYRDQIKDIQGRLGGKSSGSPTPETPAGGGDFFSNFGGKARPQ